MSPAEAEVAVAAAAAAEVAVAEVVVAVAEVAVAVAEVAAAVAVAVPQWPQEKLLLWASPLAGTAAGARMQGPSRSEPASGWPRGWQASA